MEAMIDQDIYGHAKSMSLSPHKLKPCSSQPLNRTSPQALAKLRKAVRAAGRVLSPLHVTRDHTIMDGHRRDEVAKGLGLTEVPVLVYDFDSSDPRCNQLFIQLNQSGRAFKPSDQLISYLQGGDPATASIQSKGDYLKELLSSLELENFIEKSGSPYTLTLAKEVARYCYPGQHASVPLVRKFIRTTINWLINVNQQQPVRRYMEEFKAPAKKLIEVINDGMPVSFPTLRRRPA